MLQTTNHCAIANLYSEIILLTLCTRLMSSATIKLLNSWTDKNNNFMIEFNMLHISHSRDFENVPYMNMHNL